MRLALATLLATLPLAAMAQTVPPQGQGVITRDQFIQRATAMAGRTFDAIDVSHTGSITRDQLRAWRQSHRGAGRPQTQPQ
jgi:Ca2+-binding EF-hand superfamily protein